MEETRPKAGIGILIFKDNKILLGKRKDSHGAGEYASPGGHLELNESIEDCVLREIAEEAGPDLKIKNLRFLCVINLRRYAPKHYLHVSMVADWKSGEPRVMEPDQQEAWDWFNLENLPSPLFGTMSETIEAYKTDKTFFEA
jgi:8-oxo-dGTP diphosphatase